MQKIPEGKLQSLWTGLVENDSNSKSADSFDIDEDILCMV